MSEINHCEDCCCAKSWEALGIAQYTNRSIPEEIFRLKEKLLLIESAVRKWQDGDDSYGAAMMEIEEAFMEEAK